METLRTRAVVESIPEANVRQGMIASVALHVTIASFIMLSTIEAQPELAEQESILVEVISTENSENAKTQQEQKIAKVPPADPAKNSEQQIETEKEPDNQGQPKSENEPIGSENKDVPITSIGAHPLPRARQVREERKAQNEDKQREALCHSEAIAQIKQARRDLEPDLVISAAVDQFIASGDILLSNGAAFRSKGLWYNFKFKCETTPDLKRVAKFDFLIGAAFAQEKIETRDVKRDN